MIYDDIAHVTTKELRYANGEVYHYILNERTGEWESLKSDAGIAYQLLNYLENLL